MKMKAVKGLAVALLTGIAMSMPVLAAPVTLPDGTVFDPEYYAQQNPDVVAAIGTDAGLLYQHYVMFGKNEGRLPYGSAANSAQTTNHSVASSTAQGTTDGKAWEAYYNSMGFSVYYEPDSTGVYIQRDVWDFQRGWLISASSQVGLDDYSIEMNYHKTSNAMLMTIGAGVYDYVKYEYKNSSFYCLNPSDALATGAATLVTKLRNKQISQADFDRILTANGFVRE